MRFWKTHVCLWPRLRSPSPFTTPSHVTVSAVVFLSLVIILSYRFRAQKPARTWEALRTPWEAEGSGQIMEYTFCRPWAASYVFQQLNWLPQRSPKSHYWPDKSYTVRISERCTSKPPFEPYKQGVQRPPNGLFLVKEKIWAFCQIWQNKTIYYQYFAYLCQKWHQKSKGQQSPLPKLAGANAISGSIF